MAGWPEGGDVAPNAGRKFLTVSGGREGTAGRERGRKGGINVHGGIEREREDVRQTIVRIEENEREGLRQIRVKREMVETKKNVAGMKNYREKRSMERKETKTHRKFGKKKSMVDCMCM